MEEVLSGKLLLHLAGAGLQDVSVSCRSCLSIGLSVLEIWQLLSQEQMIWEIEAGAMIYFMAEPYSFSQTVIPHDWGGQGNPCVEVRRCLDPSPRVWESNMDATWDHT